MRATDLKTRIEELLRIKGSVGMELRDLEARRGKLQQEVVSLNHKIDELKGELVHQQMELDRVKISVQQVPYWRKYKLDVEHIASFYNSH